MIPENSLYEKSCLMPSKTTVWSIRSAGRLKGGKKDAVSSNIFRNTVNSRTKKIKPLYAF